MASSLPTIPDTRRDKPDCGTTTRVQGSCSDMLHPDLGNEYTNLYTQCHSEHKHNQVQKELKSLIITSE